MFIPFFIQEENSEDRYKVSGGLHGVGAAVVNALSEWMEVEVLRDGKRYRQRYERGKAVTGLEIVGEAEGTGTITTFMPDKEIFDEIEYDYDILLKRFRELAFLNKGLTIQLRDEREEEPKEATLHYEGGIISFVKYINQNKDVIHEDIIYFEGKKENAEIEIAFQYTDSYVENVFSFANNIPTTEGGTHVTGFKAAITKVINDYARKANLLKENDKNLMVKIYVKELQQ